VFPLYQILLLNLVTSTPPTMVLGIEKPPRLDIVPFGVFMGVLVLVNWELVIYVELLNTKIFKEKGITWEWTIVIVTVVFFESLLLLTRIVTAGSGLH